MHRKLTWEKLVRIIFSLKTLPSLLGAPFFKWENTLTCEVIFTRQFLNHLLLKEGLLFMTKQETRQVSWQW